jgi:putative ABC transport system permease protein
MISDYFSLAFRNLKHRGVRSWLTLIGIFIGIAAVVSLITLGAGLQMAISAQFGISSTEVITIQAGGLNGYGPPGTGVDEPLTLDDLGAVKRISLVERAIKRNVESLRSEFNDVGSISYGINIPNGQDRKFVYDTLEIKTLSGRLLKDSDSGRVVLGYNLAQDGGPFGKKIRVGNSILLNDEKFEVVGISEKKGSLIFDNVVYMNQKDLEDLVGNEDNVDVIVAQLKDSKDMERAKVEIEKVLRRTRNVDVGEENFEVSTPDAMLGTVNSILGGVQAFVIIIASISILVGAVGIVNTMTTSVLERRKEIGIMKSIGAKNSQVFLQFFLEAGLLGLIGGVVGAIFGEAIGILGTMGINSFLGIEVLPTVNFILIGGALTGSFLIGAISGIVPALNAAKQNPVEALRG